MKITREEVLRVAELAHLELAESEVETFRRQLDEILTYVGKLNELDTSSVEPMAQVLTGTSEPAAAENSTLREDRAAACDVAAEVLSRAPDPAPPFFRVPKVIDR